MTIHPLVKDEFSSLKVVVLGTARSFGPVPSLEEAYDPKSKEHIKAGTYPKEEDLIPELENFAKILQKYGVEVVRPEVIADYNQIFTRDIGFVVDDKLVIANVIPERDREIDALKHILKRIPDTHLIDVPDHARIEGGDVMPIGNQLFIGFSKPEDFKEFTVSRTNKAALNFMAETFPDRPIKAFELKKSDDDPRDNALHLDCCFQPLGLGHALLFKEGFKNQEDVEFILDTFGADNIIDVGREEMYEMQCNLFSISPDVLVSDSTFSRLNNKLRSLGYTVEEVYYRETSKMEGLLRCSTMPLVREYNS